MEKGKGELVIAAMETDGEENDRPILEEDLQRWTAKGCVMEIADECKLQLPKDLAGLGRRNLLPPNFIPSTSRSRSRSRSPPPPLPYGAPPFVPPPPSSPPPPSPPRSVALVTYSAPQAPPLSRPEPPRFPSPNPTSTPGQTVNNETKQIHNYGPNNNVQHYSGSNYSTNYYHCHAEPQAHYHAPTTSRPVRRNTQNQNQS